MQRRARGFILLFAIALAQPGATLAVACEPSSHHEHCAAHQDDGRRSSVPHEIPNCGAMVACTPVLALPAPACVLLQSPVDREQPLSYSILLHSRVDRPANPPPRA
jgi:hypothetical protein